MILQAYNGFFEMRANTSGIIRNLHHIEDITAIIDGIEELPDYKIKS
jgi:hypothetical protein